MISDNLLEMCIRNWACNNCLEDLYNSNLVIISYKKLLPVFCHPHPVRLSYDVYGTGGTSPSKPNVDIGENDMDMKVIFSFDYEDVEVVLPKRECSCGIWFAMRKVE